MFEKKLTYFLELWTNCLWLEWRMCGEDDLFYRVYCA